MNHHGTNALVNVVKYYHSSISFTSADLNMPIVFPITLPAVCGIVYGYH